MADLTVTAASVVAGANATKESGIAGETITAGQPVYKSTTTFKYMKADNNSATEAARSVRGIALNGASDGQPLVIQTKGDLTIGATMTAGIAYYLSDTAGGICPVADIGTGEYVSLIGVSKSTTVLAVNPQSGERLAVTVPSCARAALRCAEFFNP
jgi:hypothetical protein